MRRKKDKLHHLVFLISGAAIGLSLWGYWRLAKDAIAPPSSGMLSVVRGPSPALAKARDDFRRAYLDPILHVRLAKTLFEEERYEDSFLVLEGARVFFGEPRFLQAHAAVVIDGDPEAPLADAAPTAWTPGGSEDLARQARAFARREEFQKALETVERGLTTNPNDVELSGLRAALLARHLERPLDALPLYRALALSGPGTPQGRVAVDFLGRLAFKSATQRVTESSLPKEARSGDPTGTQAIETLSELYRKHPDDPRVFQNLAMLRWSEERVDLVREMTKEALARNPNQAGARSMAGALALADKDPHGAIKHFEAALKTDPHDLYSAQKLAELEHSFRADRDASLALWIRAHHLDPGRVVGGQSIRALILSMLASRALDAVGDSQGPAAIDNGLDSQDGAVRAQACFKVGATGDQRWLGRLGNMLDDDTELVRKSADEGLFKLGQKQPQALKDAGWLWLDADSVLVRTRALNLFADLFPKETLPKGLAALKSPDPAVRAVTRLALQHYYPDDGGAKQAIVEYLNEETSELAWLLYRSREDLEIPKLELPPAKGARPPAEPAKAKPVAKREKPAVTAADFRRKGGALLRAGKPRDAADALARADALSPDDPETLLLLAMAFSRQKDAGQAASALRRCLLAAQGGGQLDRFLRRARNEDQLSYLRKQAGFDVIVRPFERGR